MTELLETVDIPGVEILSTGGPVHGQGSPPQGDYWTLDDLRAMEQAAHELADEIQPPNKIGHSDAQTLVKNSALTPGEMPAVGWLDPSTARVVEDGDGGGKLVMDARAVPKKFAALVNAKAYRTRSVELSRVTSQKTGRVYDWVVTGLAWLGAKLPAVQTLDDVLALYEARQLEHPDDVRAIVLYAADPGEVVWDPEAGFQDLMSDLQAALNPGPGDNQYWVSDISVDRTRAIVNDYDGDQAWVVPFTLDAQGEPSPAPASEWIAAEQAWVAAADDLSRKNQRPAESRQMALELTDQDVALLREKLGLDTDTEVTPETLAAAAEQRANELAEATRKLESDDTTAKLRELEQDLETEKRRSFEQRRDADIKEALRTRELDPADTEKWEKRYETLGEENARELLFELPKRNLTRELGDDADGDGDIAPEQQRKLESELSAVFPGYEPAEVEV